MGDTAPPKKGAQNLNLNNKTPAARNSKKMQLECPVCAQTFERYACWARRVNENYCGRGCAAAAKRIEVERRCTVCDKAFITTPSLALMKTTCGPVCSSVKKRAGRARSADRVHYAAHEKAAKQIAAKGICSQCGVTHGPWVVRGVRVVAPPDAVPFADVSVASLWCRQCHLASIAADGGRVRAPMTKAAPPPFGSRAA